MKPNILEDLHFIGLPDSLGLRFSIEKGWTISNKLKRLKYRSMFR